MALPLGTDVEYIGENASGGMSLGYDATEKISFYGVTPIVQPSGATQAAVSITTVNASGFGFSSSAAFYSFFDLVHSMRTALVNLGLIKGSS